MNNLTKLILAAIVVAGVGLSIHHHHHASVKPAVVEVTKQEPTNVPVATPTEPEVAPVTPAVADPVPVVPVTAKPAAKHKKHKRAQPKRTQSGSKRVAPKAEPKAPAPPVRLKREDDQAAARADCTPDALRLCAMSIAGGRDAIISCMVQHKAQLSQQCVKHFR